MNKLILILLIISWLEYSFGSTISSKQLKQCEGKSRCIREENHTSKELNVSDKMKLDIEEARSGKDVNTEVIRIPFSSIELKVQRDKDFYEITLGENSIGM